MNPVLDQAARVLDHQPTRSMDAEQLYRRVTRETGVSLPFDGFMKAVRERPGRFAVIAADPGIGTARAWDARQRSLYQAALEAAGLLNPLIVLTERRATEPAPGDAPVTPDDIIAEAQDSLVHLLHSADVDSPLRTTFTRAMDDLLRLRRALHSTGQ